MMTSHHAWQPLIDDTRMDERGNVGVWAVRGRRVTVDKRPRYGRWSYAAWVDAQHRKASFAAFLENMRRENPTWPL